MTPEQRKLWVRQMGARREWWNLRKEAIIEPDWEIVDAHFHLWEAKRIYDPADNRNWLDTSPYLLNEFLYDTTSGHKITDCIFVECGTAYRNEGPMELRPVGETQYISGLAGQLEKQGTKIGITGIVAFADLRCSNLDDVLDAHLKFGLVRGIRYSGARMEDPSGRLLFGAAPADLYQDKDFRRGLAQLGERGLVFDALQFDFQCEEICALAKEVSTTTIVINHLGMPIGYGRVPEEQDRLYTVWTDQIKSLARLPNVMMKLGGLASVVTEYDGASRKIPPSSEEFVAERGAYYHYAIKCFGSERCMFESNFPVDSASISYPVLWNSHKIIAMEYSAAEREELLSGTARRIYKI